MLLKALIIYIFHFICVGNTLVIKPLVKYNWNFIHQLTLESTRRGTNKYDWRFQHYLVSDKNDAPTMIPSGIFSDLKEKDFIEDIFYGYNDVEFRSVVDSDNFVSHYYCTFPAKISMVTSPNVELVFYGIDGTARIHLNGKEIGHVSNTFVKYRFDVTNKLKDSNDLLIIFDSPTKKVDELLKKYEIYKSSRQRNALNIPNVHLLRRMQASFGTEWAPAIPSFGIWKDIELINYEDDVIIRDITVITVKNNQIRKWKIEIGVHCDVPSRSPPSADKASSSTSAFSRDLGRIQAFLKVNNTTYDSKVAVLRRTSAAETSVMKNLVIYVEQNKVKQWWPNGYGPQYLYELEIRLTDRNNDYITKSIFIGFRTVTLNQKDIAVDAVENEEVPKLRRFNFIVNDTPIFVKGTSFHPINILLEKSYDEKKIEYLLQSAQTVHMNMIRVPASSIYQSDYFYQKCDEYGLLVWQEMMFDREIYPLEDEEFTKSITEEITQQFLRLQYHASVAIWVANNEIESTLSDIDDKTKQEKWISDYAKFLKIFTNIIKYDKFRPYLSSTPSSNNVPDIENIKIIKDQNNFLVGDAHIYSVRKTWVVEYDEQVPRFVSQYGAWSLPSYRSLVEKSFTGDLESLQTEFMQHRIRSDTKDIYEEIIDAVPKHFGYPKKNNLVEFIYACQIVQAWTMRLETENYRKYSSIILPSPLHTGFTMGAIMSQLNDVWQAPSTASIEYDGQWKMLHYYAYYFFNPIGSALQISSSQQISIQLICDLRQDLNIRLKFEVFYWHSLQPVQIIHDRILLKRLSSIEYTNDDVTNMIHSNCGKTDEITKNCLFKLTIYDKKKMELTTNYLLPATLSFRDITHLPNPRIKIQVSKCSFDNCTLLVTTDSIALFVWLKIDIKGLFSDNGFILTEPVKEIYFYPEVQTNREEIEKKITFKVIGRNYILQNFNDEPESD